VNITVQLNFENSGSSESSPQDSKMNKEVASKLKKMLREFVEDEKRPGGSLYNR